MAFPATTILDDFTGTDETPITTGWAAFLTGDSGPLARISNQLTDAGGGTDTSSYYDASGGVFGPDCEVYATIATASAVAADQFKLFARIVNPTLSTMSGYELHVEKSAGTDIWRIRRRDSTTPTVLGADMNQEIASGDSVGMSVVGTTISAYYKSGAGSWTLVGSRTDSTYSAAGVTGVKTTQTVTRAWKADNYGGGTISGGGGGGGSSNSQSMLLMGVG